VIPSSRITQQDTASKKQKQTNKRGRGGEREEGKEQSVHKSLGE
jgi:hypothetical protein